VKKLKDHRKIALEVLHAGKLRLYGWQQGRQVVLLGQRHGLCNTRQDLQRFALRGAQAQAGADGIDMPVHRPAPLLL